MFANKNIILLIVFIFICICGYFAQNFKLDASSDTLILQNDKDFKYFNFYNNIFPTKNFLVVAIESKKEIDTDYIKNINLLKNSLMNINGVESIFSIVDAPILLLNNLNLSNILDQEISNINNSKYDLQLILEEFATSPIFKDQIINSKKTVSSLIIYLEKDNNFSNIKKQKEYIINNKISNTKEIKEINNKYRLLKEQYNKKRNILISSIKETLSNQNNKYIYFLGGIDMIADDTLQFVKNDILKFSIVVLLFIIIILFFIFRDLKWVILPLISTAYAVISMVGLIGMLNWEVTAISSNFISLMLILSISMNVHIINNYKKNYSEVNSKNNLKNTLKIMFWPCFYTALTTVVAFGSLLFSDIKPVIDFGKIMILSLIIIFISSFTILPLFISLFPKINKNNYLKFSILNRFFLLSINHTKKIFFINFIIFLISLFGIYNLKVENSFINYFKEKTEIHKGMKLIDQELGGTTPIDIIIRFKNENKLFNNNVDDDILEINEDFNLDGDLFIEDKGISNWLTVEKLTVIKNIHNFLEQKKEIGKVQSLYSLINMAELMNKQELSIFELSILYNKIPEYYKNDLILPYLSIDENLIKISARVKDSKDIKRQKLIQDINAFLDSEFSIIEEFNVNGLLILYNNMLQSLFSSQIKSFGIILLTIFIMLLILFQSFKLSLVGIIPNIFAASFILGFIGLARIPLDIMTITIAAITIGIAVDNTIHYLYRVKNNINNGMYIKESLENSHQIVGYAVLTTSLTIAFGFSVLSLSNFVPTILFGLFTGLAMIIAMLGVLITLPAGLLKINL